MKTEDDLINGQDISCSRPGNEREKCQRVVHRMLFRYHSNSTPTTDILNMLSTAQAKPSCVQCESDASVLLQNVISRQPMSLLSSQPESMNNISWSIVRPLNYFEIMRSCHFKVDIWKKWNNPDEILSQDLIQMLNGYYKNSFWIPTEDIVRISREVDDMVPFNTLELVLLAEKSMEIENSDSENNCIERSDSIGSLKYGHSNYNKQRREWVLQQKIHRQMRRKERRKNFKKAQKEQRLIEEDQSEKELVRSRTPEIKKLVVQILQNLISDDKSKPSELDSLNYEKLAQRYQPTKSFDNIDEIKFQISSCPSDRKDKNESPSINNDNEQPSLAGGDATNVKNSENESQSTNDYNDQLLLPDYDYNTFDDANNSDYVKETNYYAERFQLRMRVNELLEEFLRLPKPLRIYYRKKFWRKEKQDRLLRRQLLRQRLQNNGLYPPNEESDSVILKQTTSLDNEQWVLPSDNEDGNCDYFDQNTCREVPYLTAAMDVDYVTEECNTESMIATTSTITATTMTSEGVSMDVSEPSIKIMASEVENETVDDIVKAITNNTERRSSVAIDESLRLFGNMADSTENNSNKSHGDFGHAAVVRSVTTVVKALSLAHIELFNGVKRMLSAVQKTMYPLEPIPAPVDQVVETSFSNASNSDVTKSDESTSDALISVFSASVDPKIIEKQNEMLRELQKLLESTWSIMLKSKTIKKESIVTSMSNYIEEMVNRAEETANNINEADYSSVAVSPTTITTMMKAYLEMLQTLKKISINIRLITKMLREEIDWMLDTYKWAGEVAKMSDRIAKVLENMQTTKKVKNNEDLSTLPSLSVPQQLQEQEQDQKLQYRSPQHPGQKQLQTLRKLHPPQIVYATVPNTENQGAARCRGVDILIGGRVGSDPMATFFATNQGGVKLLPDEHMLLCDDPISRRPPPFLLEVPSTASISSSRPKLRPTRESTARSTSTGSSTARPSTEEISTDRPLKETSTETSSTKAFFEIIHSNTSTGNVDIPNIPTPSTVHTSTLPISSKEISIVKSSLITTSNISTPAVQNSIKPISVTLKTSIIPFVKVKDSIEISPSIEPTFSILTSTSPTLTSTSLISGISQTSNINISKEKKLLNNAVIPYSIDMEIFNGLRATGVLASNLFLSQQPSPRFVDSLIQSSMIRMAVIITALTAQRLSRKQVSSDRKLLRRDLNGPLRQHSSVNEDADDKTIAYCEESIFSFETESPKVIVTPTSDDDILHKQLLSSPDTRIVDSSDCSKNSDEIHLIERKERDNDFCTMVSTTVSPTNDLHRMLPLSLSPLSAQIPTTNLPDQLKSSAQLVSTMRQHNRSHSRNNRQPRRSHLSSSSSHKRNGTLQWRERFLSSLQRTQLLTTPTQSPTKEDTVRAWVYQHADLPFSSIQLQPSADEAISRSVYTERSTFAGISNIISADSSPNHSHSSTSATPADASAEPMFNSDSATAVFTPFDVVNDGDFGGKRTLDDRRSPSPPETNF